MTGYVKVDQYWKDLLKKGDYEEIQAPLFPENTEPAKVSVGVDYTRQIRSFEPIKISIHVSLPCAAVDSEIRAAYDYANNLINEKMAVTKAQINAVVNEGE